MVKLQNLISRTSVPPFQKKPFFKVGALKTYVMLPRKTPGWSLFLIKFRSFRPATLLKRDSNKGVFLRILQKF